jgi:hypothetical protein
MQTLIDADLRQPIVAVGRNPERFDGRNLALHLIAIGYAATRRSQRPGG